VHHLPIWFDDNDYGIVAAAAERLIPADALTGAPGARAGGVADYIDQLLGAFAFDPPHIFAGGPFSGRHGGDDGFSTFLPLGRLEELAWRTRIEGSNGIAEREINGPTIGWQQAYREGITALGRDFVDASPDAQDARLGALPSFVALLYGHACEAMYGDPAYGGNRDRVAWTFIDFRGDTMPRGWTDAEVSHP